jgi:hypothetical protein
MDSGMEAVPEGLLIENSLAGRFGKSLKICVNSPFQPDVIRLSM